MGRPAHITGTIRRKGKTYKIYDAFPAKSGAKRAAKDLRSPQGAPLDPKRFKTYAITHDMGKNAGRLRHGVFTRSRPRSLIPKRRRKKSKRKRKR